MRFHFVLVDYLCRPVGGPLRHGSDVEAVAVADPEALAKYALTEKAFAVIRRGFDMAAAPSMKGAPPVNP